MADEDNQKPFGESAIFPWLESVAQLWLNMVKTVPPHSSTLLKAQNAVQERFSQQLDEPEHAQVIFQNDEAAGGKICGGQHSGGSAGNFSENRQIRF